MSEGIASKPPLATTSKYVTVQNTIDPPNTWILAAVSGGVLLLYSLSRIIALQKRVRGLEARPPVDDIVMRGMIRQQVSEMVSDLEQSIRARNSIVKHVQKAPSIAVQEKAPMEAVQADTVPASKMQATQPTIVQPFAVVSSPAYIDKASLDLEVKKEKEKNDELKKVETDMQQKQEDSVVDIVVNTSAKKTKTVAPKTKKKSVQES
jgi:hypothetical protein